MNRCVIRCETDRALEVAWDTKLGAEGLIRLGLELQVHHRCKCAMMIWEYDEGVVQISADVAGRACLQRLHVPGEVMIFDNLDIVPFGGSIVKRAKTRCEGA